MSWGRMPSREAVSRSITRAAWSPRFCWSVETSRSPSMVRSLASMRGAKAFSSMRSVLCSVYWYCELLMRPPMRTSCTACRKRVAPGTWASLPRRRWITRSTGSFRSPHGLSTTKRRPVFVVLPVPPVKATTLLTSGSAITVVTNSPIVSRMASDEIPCSAGMAMRDKMGEFVTTVMADPDVSNVVAFTGGTGNTTNTGRLFVVLKPWGERKLPVDLVIQRLRGKLAHVPGATLFLQAVQDVRIGGRMGNSQYQYTLQSTDLNELNAFAPRMLAKLRTIEGLRDVSTDQQNRGLQASLVIDRDTASRLGILPQLIDDTLYDAFGQRQVSNIYTPLNQYHVILEVPPQYQQNPDALKSIYVKSSTGKQFPLSAFTHFAESTTPLAVNHQGFFPAVTLSFNLAPGVALGDAVANIQAAERQMNMPPSILASFQGTAQAFQASLASQPILILAALVTVYIVLGVLYESFIHPITILSTLPSAGVGAILALLLCGGELNIIAMIGIILLIGIVKKNAILMIDFALDVQRDQDRAPQDAIYQACLLRFRPIMMTTAAALLGALPLALGTGVGAELRRPLGITIVGGLLVSQLLTLYTTPVVYLYLERFRLRIARRRERASTLRIPGPVVTSQGDGGS